MKRMRAYYESIARWLLGVSDKYYINPPASNKVIEGDLCNSQHWRCGDTIATVVGQNITCSLFHQHAF